MEEQTVIIIGGGFGGLSAACYLADAGAEVTLLEKNERLGGLAEQVSVDGFQFDAGPTWYMMPEVFGNFFKDFGRSPANYYSLQRLEPSYRVYFKDGDRIDITTDRATLCARFDEVEPGAGEALVEYLAGAKRTYEVSMEKFIYTDRPRFRDWIGRDVLEAGPVGFELWGDLDAYTRKFFDSQKLRQIVQYAAVFLGGPPWKTPRLYHMMSHIDITQGVYYPKGGFSGVVTAVADLARELGVTIETGVEVTEIARGRDGFFVAAGDRLWRADAVVSDADYAHTELELLPERDRQYSSKYWEDRKYGPSAFIMFLGIDREVLELEHHNIVMPVSWDDHFRQIYEEESWSTDPVYYVCNATRTDPTTAPDGKSALMISTAVPAGTKDSDHKRSLYREQLLTDLSQTTGLDFREDIVYEETRTISDFMSRYNAWRGSLGLAQSLRQTGPFRPGHRSKTVKGLYYAGSATNPGVGAPICLISGKHVASRVQEDF